MRIRYLTNKHLYSRMVFESEGKNEYIDLCGDNDTYISSEQLS